MTTQPDFLTSLQAMLSSQAQTSIRETTVVEPGPEAVRSIVNPTPDAAESVDIGVPKLRPQKKRAHSTSAAPDAMMSIVTACIQHGRSPSECREFIEILG